MSSDGNNPLSIDFTDRCWPAFGDLGFVPIPVGVSRFKAFEPFKEPILGPAEISIY